MSALQALGSSDSFAPKPPPETIAMGALRYDKASGAIHRDGEIMELTPRELALARLLLRRNASLWLLDEPTEGLDTRTAQDVLARLAQEAQQRQCSLVIATHLRREARLADRLLCMRGGRLVADLRRGTPSFEAALDALRQD